MKDAENKIEHLVTQLKVAENKVERLEVQVKTANYEVTQSKEKVNKVTTWAAKIESKTTTFVEEVIFLMGRVWGWLSQRKKFDVVNRFSSCRTDHHYICSFLDQIIEGKIQIIGQ